ncbi:MAG: uroporphyrinogen-III C-methyltransferase [Pirellulales bacterium]|nr:uroporphyrinogen-III C-methyltransferase [Pirellulales bacterium]
MPGKVYLVGAGPGDPGLITLRGQDCLARAQVVYYDYLVNPLILEMAAPDCQKICLGKHGSGRQLRPEESGTPPAPSAGQRLWSQAEINAALVEQALAGKTVVRLKSGDPLIFGRLAEECAALAAHDIPFEIVPGITAAWAAASYAGVFVTQRQYASAVALVTGHEQEDKSQPGVDYKALAHFPGTLVYYMGVTRVAEWSGALLTGGKSPTTPVVVIRRCAWPDQQTWTTTLEHVADFVKQRELRPPVLCIVGEVAAAREQASWFAARPLFGRRILVTRPADQAADLVKLLADQGADCAVQPLIQILPPPDLAALDQAICALATEQYAWIAFSSANGVRYFCERLWQLGHDARAFGKTKIAAIGPATGAALGHWHLKGDVMPDTYEASAMAGAIIQAAGGQLADARCLLVRASRGREVLAEQLAAAGGKIEQIVVYESRDLDQPDPQIATDLSEGKFDWMTITSSAIARAAARLFGSALRQTRLVSISPLTSAVLAELGYPAALTANEATMPGIVRALVEGVKVAG